MRFAPFPVLLAFTLSAVGCSGGPTLQQLQSSGLHTVSVSPRVVKPDRYAYLDETAKRAGAAGAGGGAIGMLVGGIVGANSTADGRARFDATARQAEAAVERTVRDSFLRELEGARIFQVARAGSPDAEFRLFIREYGAAPAGPDRLSARVKVEAQLVRPDGTVVWKQEEDAESSLANSLADYERQPRLFLEALEQAARNAAQKLVREH